MQNVNAYLAQIERASRGELDMHDLSDDVARIVRESNVRVGQVTIAVPGSTAGITTIEYEPGALADLARAIERLAPRDIDYEHDRRWGDGNGYSHVRAALLGPALCLPVFEGRPVLGTWQQILLVDCDNRPRSRRVTVSVVGQTEDASLYE